MEKNAKILMFLYIFNENKYIYLINKNQSSIILCNAIYYNLNKYMLILQTIMEGNEMSTVDLKLIDGVLDEYASVPGSLITILQQTQDIYGYLPKEAIEKISDKTGIATSEIMGVGTFYTQFRFQPVGKYLIMLCQGTACHVNSSELILQTIKDELHIEDGETTEDGLFSLKCVACLGCCSLSPVMMINDNTYGSLTPDKTKKILKELREAAQ